MSRYLVTLNRVRQAAELSWLTPSQQQAYQLVRERLEFLDEVNLWGQHGVGKTFLGWMLWKHRFADYAPTLRHVVPRSLLRIVVVDNLGWRRAEVREVVRHCRQMGYERVVLVTAEPVHEQMCLVELALTDRDMEHAIESLRRAGIVPCRDDKPRSLWDLVSPVDLHR